MLRIGVKASSGLVWALVAMAFAVGAGCAPAETESLRVMSYNIHHGEGTDGVFDLERIASVINEHKPDLVALQEVDRATSRSSGVDQAAELARLTGMKHVYGTAMDYAGGQYGEAILSRWPIVTSVNYILPNAAGSEPRALVVAAIVHPEFGEVIFAGTHLAHDAASDRLEQARLIATILLTSTFAKRTVIQAGDFNALPDSEPMRVLFDEAGFADAFESDPRPTFPNVEPDRRIDYILYRGPRMWRVVESIVITDESASDHCAIVAELR